MYHYRLAYWDDVDFSTDWVLRTPVFHNKLKTYIDQLVAQNVDSLVKYADWITQKTLANPELFKYTANYIAKKYKEPKFMGGEAVMVHMINTYFTDSLATWSTPEELYSIRYINRIREKSLPGKLERKSWQRELRENRSILSRRFPNSGFAHVQIYCEHCQEQIPPLVKLYEKWRSKGLDVYALCLDENVEEWKSFVSQYTMPFRNVIDPGITSKYDRNYHVDHTPEIYVMNDRWEIVAKDMLTHQLEPIFEKMIGKE